MEVSLIHVGVEMVGWSLLLGILGWLGRVYARRLDDHIQECNLRHEKQSGFEATVMTKLQYIEKQVSNVAS